MQNIEQLIACRVLLGLATASVVPAAMTIMGDAIPMERRAKMPMGMPSWMERATAYGPHTTASRYVLKRAVVGNV